MSKRRKVSTTHTSLRLPPDLLIEVNKIAMHTGWSNAKVIGFLADLGVLAIKGGEAAMLAARAVLARAVKVHAIERENAIRLAQARRESKSVDWRKVISQNVKKAAARPRVGSKIPSAIASGVKAASAPEST